MVKSHLPIEEIPYLTMSGLRSGRKNYAVELQAHLPPIGAATNLLHFHPGETLSPSHHIHVYNYIHITEPTTLAARSTPAPKVQ